MQWLMNFNQPAPVTGATQSAWNPVHSVLSNYHQLEIEMSNYDFNPARCKRAIETLSKMVHDKGYAKIPDREKVLLNVILEDLILDIEDLHRRATAYDDLYDSVASLPTWESNNGEYVPADEVQALVDDWKHDPVAELNL